MKEPRIVFGFCLLIAIAILAGIIAIAKVEQATSHGLDIVLGSLATLAGGFSNWAFTKKDGNP
jgi:hypothetical protein